MLSFSFIHLPITGVAIFLEWYEANSFLKIGNKHSDCIFKRRAILNLYEFELTVKGPSELSIIPYCI